MTITNEQKRLLKKAIVDLKYVDQKAAEYAGVGHTTAQKYRVKVFNLDPNGQLSVEQKKLILEAHKPKCSSYKVADYVGVSRQTVLDYWEKCGLKIPGKNKKISQEKVEKIFEAHKLVYSTRNSSEYAGVSRQTVLDYWKKKGLKAHGKKSIETEISDKSSEQNLEGLVK